ncbi:MAG: ATP-binding protein [Myxococcota bacterium]
MSGDDPAAVRILAVDDEVRGMELLQRALRRIGTVDGATSGQQAWEMFQETDYQLVLSDQRMPGMKGVELLTRIAEASPYCGRMLVTGYADLDSTIDAINSGRVHAYVAKPCDPRDLRARVQGVLDRVLLAGENARLLSLLQDRNAELERALQELREAQARVVCAEQLAAVGRTVSMIVHDLRGPVAVLRSSGGVLAGQAAELPPEEIQDLAREILEEAEELERMCAHLRETGPSGDRGDRQPGNAGDVASAAASVVAEAAAHQAVRVELDLRDDDAELDLDRAALRRALVNLLYNSIEAMPDGGELRVETRVEDGCVRVSVLDSGPGVPEAIRQRLFEPFFTQGKPKGTGLGLAVVAQVAEQHGGRVEVGKAEGGGAAFHLLLPLGR